MPQQYGALELGQQQRQEEEQEHDYTSSYYYQGGEGEEEGANINTTNTNTNTTNNNKNKPLGWVIGGLVAVLLTVLSLSSPSSSRAVSSKGVAPPARLMAPSPPADDREGGWQDFVPDNAAPKGVIPGKDNSTTTTSNTTTTTPAHGYAGNHTTWGPKPTPPPPPHVYPKHARNCTLLECKTFSGCNATVSPYVCVAGFARGGCAKVKSAWEHPGCDDYCSLTSCKSEVPKCGNCTVTDCVRMKSVCGFKRRYACVDGPANGGCSAEPSYWPDATLEGTCGRCCDLSTCKATMQCTVCTDAECLQIGNCPKMKPYACTTGAAAKGCGSEAFWQEAEYEGSCEACCDTSYC